MGFVPVYLDPPDRAVRETHTGNAFSLPPPPAAIELSQAGNLPDGGADRKCFSMRYLTN